MSGSVMSRRARTAAVAIVVAMLAVAGIGLWMVDREEPVRLSADFRETVGLYPGSDVQILGVPVGRVTKVTPRGGVVRVSMELDRGQRVGADTAAVIVAPTLVSDRFVQLTKPYAGGQALSSGTTIPMERTAVPVEIDELYASLDDLGQQLGPNGINKNGALSRFLDVAAANLDGQGTDLNTMIAEFGKATDTLADTDQDFFATLANLKEFNDMLVSNDRGVARANRQFAEVAGYLAEDREDISAAIANLGSALGILDDFIRDNRAHMTSSLESLRGPTKTLTRQQRSLEEAVRMAPVLVQNFLASYGSSTNTLDGRGNLNELTLWSGNGLSARTSPSAPPVMVPGVDGER